MNFWQAFILAVIQGLTEFLPVSSSGHLVIFQKLLGFQKPPLFFDILVHLGTLGAILVFFRDKISALLRDRRLIFLLGVATLPICFFALFLEKFLDPIFNSLWLTGLSYLLMALILFSTRFLKDQVKRTKGVGWLDALAVGLFQALAIFPGLSRSGSTIIAGLWRGFDRETAFDFSLFLGILAIGGAFIFKVPGLGGFSSGELGRGLLAMLVAGLVGYFSLRILKDLIQKNKLFWFGFYCLFLGLIILGWEWGLSCF